MTYILAAGYGFYQVHRIARHKFILILGSKLLFCILVSEWNVIVRKKVSKVGGSFGPIGSAVIYLNCISFENNRADAVVN